MMWWDDGWGMGWMWLSGLLTLAGIAALVLLIVRLLGGGIGRSAPPDWYPSVRSTTRQILDERFARGELSAEQYREQLKVLGEGT